MACSRSVSHHLARLHMWRMQSGSDKDSLRGDQNVRSAGECKQSVKNVDNVRIRYICGRKFRKYVRVRHGSGNSFSFIDSSDAEKEKKKSSEVFSVVSALASVTGYGSQQARYGRGHGLTSLFFVHRLGLWLQTSFEFFSCLWLCEMR